MVEAIQDGGERSQVAADATEQIVEHGIVQLQPTSRGTLTQYFATAGFIKRLHRQPRALFQP